MSCTQHTLGYKSLAREKFSRYMFPLYFCLFLRRSNCSRACSSVVILPH